MTASRLIVYPFRRRDAYARRGFLKKFEGCPCPYCYVVMTRDRGWHAPVAPSRDHKIPRSRGGLAFGGDNIIVCCRGCNEDKGSLTSDEYIAVRAGLASRLDRKRP